MRQIIKLIMAPVFLILMIILLLQAYNHYQVVKVRFLLKKWKKKYHPFSIMKEA